MRRFSMLRQELDEGEDVNLFRRNGNCCGDRTIRMIDHKFLRRIAGDGTKFLLFSAKQV